MLRLCCCSEELGAELTRCTEKLRTAVLPYDALEATMLAVTCYTLTEKCGLIRKRGTYFFDPELSGVDEVQSGSKPFASRSFYPRRSREEG